MVKMSHQIIKKYSLQSLSIFSMRSMLHSNLTEFIGPNFLESVCLHCKFFEWCFPALSGGLQATDFAPSSSPITWMPNRSRLSTSDNDWKYLPAAKPRVYILHHHQLCLGVKVTGPTRYEPLRNLNVPCKSRFFSPRNDPKQNDPSNDTTNADHP